jgi:hypothetical protein
MTVGFHGIFVPNHVTEKDPPEAQNFAERWNSTSPEARSFAIAQGGRFPGILPHTLAEIFDLARESV